MPFFAVRFSPPVAYLVYLRSLCSILQSSFRDCPSSPPPKHCRARILDFDRESRVQSVHRKVRANIVPHRVLSIVYSRSNVCKQPQNAMKSRMGPMRALSSCILLFVLTFAVLAPSLAHALVNSNSAASGTCIRPLRTPLMSAGRLPKPILMNADPSRSFFVPVAFVDGIALQSPMISTPISTYIHITSKATQISPNQGPQRPRLGRSKCVPLLPLFLLVCQSFANHFAIQCMILLLFPSECVGIDGQYAPRFIVRNSRDHQSAFICAPDLLFIGKKYTQLHALLFFF